MQHVYEKRNKHTETGAMTIDKICKAGLPKNLVVLTNWKCLNQYGDFSEIDSGRLVYNMEKQLLTKFDLKIDR